MYSIFDIFKVSIGPSSSHTMGPMIAAKHFGDLLLKNNNLDRIQARLYGSLAYTGRAHGSDKGIVLGLEGFTPETITTQEIKKRVSKVKKSGLITISDISPFLSCTILVLS